MNRLLTLLTGFAGVAAVCAALYLTGFTLGQSRERVKWEKMQADAQREALEQEARWAKREAESRQALEIQEREIEERKQRMQSAWQALVGTIPDCRLPDDVSLYLNEAAGLPGTPPVAGPSDANPAPPARP